MGVDNTSHNIGLDLGLGLGSCLVDQEFSPQLDHQSKKKQFPSLKNDHHQILTLGPSLDHRLAGDHRQQASSLSAAASSFSNSSVKKGEVELERTNSSRISCDQDHEEGSPRKKLRLTKKQSAILEESFQQHSSLNPKLKQALAEMLNLRPRQIEVWFQNRRARTKLKQTETDCEILKKCCETLKEENKRLQKEVEELKTLKVKAAQYFMPLPVATLTMCPSCERVAAVGGDVGSPSKNFTVGKSSHLYSPFTHHHPSTTF